MFMIRQSKAEVDIHVLGADYLDLADTDFVYLI